MSYKPAFLNGNEVWILNFLEKFKSKSVYTLSFKQLVRLSNDAKRHNSLSWLCRYLWDVDWIKLSSYKV